jgi:hypothetical protein
MIPYNIFLCTLDMWSPIQVHLIFQVSLWSWTPELFGNHKLYNVSHFL